jgi:DHH family
MNKLIKTYQDRYFDQTHQQQLNQILAKGFFTQFSKHDYMLNLPYMLGVEMYCLRLLFALSNSEQVCIYSDFDTDAVCAASIMYLSLIDLGFKKDNLSYYSPDRLEEGYGMNKMASKKLSGDYNLLITVDCGINSIDEADIFANSKCDLIITDHHDKNHNIPKALAVINPKLISLVSDNDFIKKSSLIENKYLKTFENSMNYPKIQAWLKGMQKTRTDNSSERQILSTSVVGAGVAWICQVWFSYFLQEIEFET